MATVLSHEEIAARERAFWSGTREKMTTLPEVYSVALNAIGENILVMLRNTRSHAVHAVPPTVTLTLDNGETVELPTLIVDHMPLPGTRCDPCFLPYHRGIEPLD